MSSQASEPAPDRVDLADLKRRSVRGGVITFAWQGMSVLINFVCTVILARLLTPADYGIMAMVVAVTAFAGLFYDLGLSSATIQKKNLTQPQQSNLFWINVAVGFSLTGILAAGSPLVMWFYGKPEVLGVTVALSATFAIGSLSAQSGALLVREMRFGRQAVAAIVGSLVNLAVAAALALNGARYWALVWGQLGSAVTTTTLLFMLSPFRPGFPGRGTGLRPMLRFGANIAAFDFVNYFHRNLDNILIGRLWGPEQLGLYSRAYSLLMFAINKLRGPITAVAFPAMSRLQSQPENYRIYYCRSTQLLAIVSMPLAAFLAIVSSPLIILLLGENWENTVPVFTVFAVVAFVQPVSTLWGLVVLSSGMGERYLRIGLLNAVCSVLGFVAGLPWGGVGVASGYAVVTYLTALPILKWALKGTSIRIVDVMRSIVRPASASLISAGVCVGGFQVLPDVPVIIHLAVAAPMFATVFVVAYRCLPGWREDLLIIQGLIRQATPLIGNH